MPQVSQRGASQGLTQQRRPTPWAQQGYQSSHFRQERAAGSLSIYACMHPRSLIGPEQAQLHCRPSLAANAQSWRFSPMKLDARAFMSRRAEVPVRLCECCRRQSHEQVLEVRQRIT